MLFNSYIFWLFFLLVLALYSLSRRNFRVQNAVLLVASYTFYGFWDWRFLSLLLVSTIIDFNVARWLERAQAPRRRKLLLLLSMCANLGVLGVFKYLGFFTESFAGLLSTLGVDSSLPVLNVLLPVGISFYTFQTMSYTIDVYRRELPATKRFGSGSPKNAIYSFEVVANQEQVQTNEVHMVGLRER